MSFPYKLRWRKSIAGRSLIRHTKGSFPGWKEIVSDGNLDAHKEIQSTSKGNYTGKYKGKYKYIFLLFSWLI